MIGIKSLLILLLVLLPFGELFRLNIGNNIYVKPLDITACLLTVWLFIWFVYKKNLRKSIKWPLVAFPIAGLLSLLLNSTWLASNELLASALYAIRWIGYVGVFFAVLQIDSVFKKKITYILFLDGLAVVLLGYIQYLFYSDIRYLISIGWDDHMHRLFSTFYDPNFAGAFLVLYLLFVVGLVFHFFKEKEKKKVFFLCIVSALTLVAILLTFSRSALFMLLAGSGMLLILLKQKKLILGLVAILIAYVVIVSPSFSIENTNLLRSASTGARLETYGNAFAIYQDRPLLGVGFNSYRYAQQDYGFRKEQPKYPSNADSGVDNSFLFVLATTGIIGFGAFLTMWGYLLKDAIYHLHNTTKKNIMAIICIASVTGLFINAFFINSLFFPTIMLWLWILFGLMHKEE